MKKQKMKTVIMAGGKGTRIASLTRDVPKPMIPINGKPVLEHEIECLRQQGFTDLLITVGHLGNVITDYFGDGGKNSPATGRPFGVKIEYYIEGTPLGNAGALFKIKDRLTEDFLLINGDVVFDVDLNRFISYHRARGGVVTLLTHPNDHPYDSGIIVTDEENRVLQWLTKEEKRPQFIKNRVNAGIHIISPSILNVNTENIGSEKVDLDRHILKPLTGSGKMFAYNSPEYVKDMGTPERYEEVKKDIISGKVAAGNLRRKQKAIFLDRDGTVNKYVGFLRNAEEFELLRDAAEAIKCINKSKYLAIVVTNQPVIARGEVSEAQLEKIHDKMETLLGQQGAYVDAIYYCPHHPDKGFDGERQELKIVCECRKPAPGMLVKAADDFNIDLKNSWMIGDSESDIEAGKTAECKTVLLTDSEKDFGQTLSKKSLLEAVKNIIR